MKQQKYRATCECGKAHRVTAGEAGSVRRCWCGRSVEVPRFSVLQESVEVSTGIADAEFRALVRTGQLPAERTCVLCRGETDRVVTMQVRCQQRRQVAVEPLLLNLLTRMPVIGLIGDFLRAARLVRAVKERDVPEEEVEYDFPVRICPQCTPRLADGGVALSAVKHTKLYANLLARHAGAEVTKVRWG